MFGKVIVIFVSFLFFIATELFFPFFFGRDEKAENQKHFWAFIFLIFSAVLGIPIEGSLATEKKIDDLQDMVQAHEHASVSRGRFADLDTIYDRNFGKADPVLTGWGDETLRYLIDRWNLGIMPLPREKAAQEIAKIYPHAEESIIASNVGSTDFYFDTRTYSRNNQDASRKGIPIVRFFLWSSKHGDIRISRGRDAKASFRVFCQEVKDLNDHLETLYSVGLNVDENSTLPEYRDLLVMDDKFAAETVFNPSSWEPIRAEATQNEDQIGKALAYVWALWGVGGEQPSATSRCAAGMSEGRVKELLKKNRSKALRGFKGKRDAESVAEYLIDAATSHVVQGGF